MGELYKTGFWGLQPSHDFKDFDINTLKPSWWSMSMTELLRNLHKNLTDDFNIDAFKAILLEAYQKPESVPSPGEIRRRTAKEAKLDYNHLDPFTQAHFQDFDVIFILRIILAQFTQPAAVSAAVKKMALWNRFDKDVNRTKMTFSIPASQRDQPHLVWYDKETELHRDVVTGETIHIGWTVNLKDDFIQHLSKDGTVNDEAKARAGLQRHLAVLALTLDTKAFRPGQDDKFCKGLDREWVHASGIRFANDKSWPREVLEHTRDDSNDDDPGASKKSRKGGITQGMKGMRV